MKQHGLVVNNQVLIEAEAPVPWKHNRRVDPEDAVSDLMNICSGLSIRDHHFSFFNHVEKLAASLVDSHRLGQLRLAVLVSGPHRRKLEVYSRTWTLPAQNAMEPLVLLRCQLEARPQPSSQFSAEQSKMAVSQGDFR